MRQSRFDTVNDSGMLTRTFWWGVARSVSLVILGLFLLIFGTKSELLTANAAVNRVIEGYAYNDVNDNGIYNAGTDATIKRDLVGVYLYKLNTSTNSYQQVATDRIDATGKYRFTGLGAGQYTVTVNGYGEDIGGGRFINWAISQNELVDPWLFRLTDPYPGVEEGSGFVKRTFTLGSTSITETYNIPFDALTTNWIYRNVYLERNNNNRYEPELGERPLPGISFDIFKDENGTLVKVQSVTTNQYGTFHVLRVDAGKYYFAPNFSADQKNKWVAAAQSIDVPITLNGTSQGSGSAGGTYAIWHKDTDGITDLRRTVEPTVIPNTPNEVNTTISWRLSEPSLDEITLPSIHVWDVVGDASGSGPKYARQPSAVVLKFQPDDGSPVTTFPITNQPTEGESSWAAGYLPADTVTDPAMVAKLRKGVFSVTYRVRITGSFSPAFPIVIGRRSADSNCTDSFSGGRVTDHALRVTGVPWRVADYETSSYNNRLCFGIPTAEVRLQPRVQFKVVDSATNELLRGAYVTFQNTALVLQQGGGEVNPDYPKLRTNGSAGSDGLTNPNFIDYAQLWGLKESGFPTHKASSTYFGYRPKTIDWTYADTGNQIFEIRLEKAPQSSLQFHVYDATDDGNLDFATTVLNRNEFYSDPAIQDVVTGRDGLTDPSKFDYEKLRNDTNKDFIATTNKPGYLTKTTNFSYQDVEGQIVQVPLTPARLKFCVVDAKNAAVKVGGARLTFPAPADYIDGNPPNNDAPHLVTGVDGCTNPTFLDYEVLESMVGQAKTVSIARSGYVTKNGQSWQYQKQANQIVTMTLDPETVVISPSPSNPINTSKPDLSIIKTFSNGSNKMTVKQGQVGTYKITATNSGNLQANNPVIIDVQSDNHAANEPHQIAWLPDSLDSGAQDPTNSHRLVWSWQGGNFAPGRTVTLNPGFIVRCNAPVTGTGTPLRNLVVISSDANSVESANNTLANNTYDNVELRIEPGDYRMSQTLQASRPRVGPGVTFTLTYRIRNDSTLSDIRHVTLSSTLPSVLTGVAGSASNGGTIQGQVVSWKIDPIPLGSTVTRTVNVTVNQGAAAQTINIASTAVSSAADPAGSCGTASASTSVRIEGPQPALSKGVSTADVEKGEEFTYYVRLNNLSDIELPGPAKLKDDLNAKLEFVRQEGCKILNTTEEDTATGTNCTSDVSASPAISGQFLEWTIQRLAPNTSVVYPIVVKARSTVELLECPVPITNRLAFERSGNPIITADAPQVNLFANQCLKGNLYARDTGGRATPEEGILIKGSDVVIDSESVLASTKSVTCTSPSCSYAKWKVANYQDAVSVGLNYNQVQDRMSRNQKRLTAEQAPLSRTQLAGTFNLYNESSTDVTYGGKAQFPDGRVWFTPGDLEIYTGTEGQEFKIVGKGTIVVGGKLRITGQGKMRYGGESFLTPGASSSDAIGFIVNGGSVTTGSVVVGSDVRQVVGAYYAPNGSIRFEGPGTKQLRPANGIFIGNAIQVIRDKVIFRYNDRLTSSVGAPPGFSFSTSPGAK